MKIGIVGLGYVGLPLAVAFCEAGHDVVGVDTDARVIEALACARRYQTSMRLYTWDLPARANAAVWANCLQ